MNTYISLLRGINVGGSKILSMDTLCDIYSGLGFSYVRTYLQSGNVVFRSPTRDEAQLANQVEGRIELVCGFRVDVFIRQPENFQAIIAHHPFAHLAGAEPGMLHVSFLYRLPEEAAWTDLAIPHDIPDKFARGEREIYLYYPNGFARAKLTTAHLEKALGVPLTNRNWNTVNALYKMAVEL